MKMIAEKLWVTAFLLLIALSLPAAEGQYFAEDFKANAGSWSFIPGSDFPGAAGGLDKFDDRLVLRADFSQGGQYVGAQRFFSEPLDFSAVRFEIRTPATQIGVRIFDGGDQSHQQYIKLSGNPDEFQTVAVKQLAGGKDQGFAFWGGANNGVLTKPVRALILIASSWDVAVNKTYTAEIRNLEFLTEQKIVALQVGKPDQLFFAPGAKPSVELKLTYFPGRPSARELEYQIVDALGNTAGSGSAKFDNQTLTVPAPTRGGFFEYVFAGMDLRFGVVCLADFAGKPDPFFGIDAVFSAFPVFQDPIRYESCLEILRRYGVSSARERMYWGALEPKPGIDWQSAYAVTAETKRQIAAKHQIKIMELFHDAPPWVLDPRFVSGKYPADLLATRKSWEQICRRWQNYWQTLEVWNEPDHGFLPGDQQMALQKAISYAAKAAGNRVTLTGGVFSGGNTTESLLSVYVKNGIAEISDAISFHNYDPAGQLESRIAAFRQALRQSPRAGIPLELSECGWPWPSGTARAAASADLKSAVYIAMKAVEAKACGINGYYPFVFGYYDEGVNNFGMIDRNATPMRSMAGYLQCVQMLANRRYAGDLTGGGNERQRVFVPETTGGDAMAVLYKDPNRPGKLVIPPGVTVKQILRVDGSRILADAIAENDAILYLLLDAKNLKLNTQTAAMALCQLARNFDAKPRQMQPIVLQGFFGADNVTSTVNGYFPVIAGKTKLTLIVNNLGNEPAAVPLTLKLPAGSRLTAGAVPATVTVNAQSKAEMKLELDLSAALTPGKFADIVLSSPQSTSLCLPVSLAKRLTANAASGIDENAPYQTINPDGGYFYWGEPVPNHRIGGEFRFFYQSPKTLILDVKVTDRRYHQPFALPEAWKGDSVQVAVQPLSADGQPTADITEIVAAQVNGEPGIFRLSSCKKMPPAKLQKSQLLFRNEGDRQYYRLLLNVDELGLPPLCPPLTLGGSFLINSNDGTGRVGYLQWGGGIGAGKNPNEFNRIKLIP